MNIQKIIVARYNEDINWLNTEMKNCIVYNKGDTPHVKRLFETQPPYALKFWKRWNDIFPDVHSQHCMNSNGFYAIQLSKRQFRFKHEMT